MKRRLLVTFTTVLALLLPATAIAHDFEVDGIYYNIDGNNVIVTFRGTSSGQYSNEYFGDVIIPSTVTFFDMTYSVTAIDIGAFEKCSGLTSITIPSSVTSIGSYAFSECTGLTSITIPSSVTSIGNSAFWSCSGLTSITIPSSVTSIGGGAFMYCSSLISITVSADNTVYDSRGNCNAIIQKSNNELIVGCKNTVIPSSVTSVGGAAFAGCSGMTSIMLPSSITTIGDYAFNWCTGMTSITIPSSVTSIGSGAFSYTGLTSIMIPSSVTSIGDNTFRGCFNLTSIALPSGVTTIGSEAFYACHSLTSIMLPSSLTTIGNYAFEWCSSLTSITLPSGVTTIGRGAFQGCSDLTTITCLASTPPIIDHGYDGTFDSSTTNRATLYVPAGTKSNYQEDWYFAQIVELLVFATNISLNKTSAELTEGESMPLTATVLPNDATDKTLTWTTSNSSIAIVSKNGVVTAVSPGMATITATTTDGTNLSASCDMTVIMRTIPATSISLNKTNAELTEGETLQLTATVLPEDATDKTVAWSTSNSSIATVSSDGLVTAKAVGIATITAMTIDGTNLSATCTVNVQVLATSISLNMTSAEMTEGGVLQLIATVLPTNATNRTVTWRSSNTSVATVNSNGIVTGINAGSATITATTTDGTNLSATCALMVKGLTTSNFFIVPDTTVQHGETIIIPVSMTNEDEILSFQTDLFLPEGFSLTVDEDDEYLVTPSERLSSDHILMAQDVSNGAVRVLCYSPNGTPITGNEGALFYLHVQVSNDAGGDYTITLRNSLLTTSDYNELSIPDAEGILTVNTFIPGDVNDSHTVTVTDIVVTAQYIMELNPSPFIFAAADMNEDENISVTDIALIAYVVNHPTMSAPHRMPALTDGCDRMSGEGITMMAGETRTVSITLDNAMDYSAFQLDLMLPEGLTASNFQLTDRAGSHALDVNALANGKTRVLCYSPAIAAIEGHSGALLTFEVTANAAVDAQIAVDGIELVTTDCRTVLLDGFAIGVNNATDVNMIDGSKTVSRVDYYNLAGQRVERPESGVTLVVTTYTDGTRTTTKVFQ